MLSPKLSKILAEKNVPHEGGMWWVADSYEDASKMTWRKEPVTKDFAYRNYQSSGKRRPAYPEIALFKYAKKLVGESPYTCKWCSKKSDNNLNSSDHCDRGYYDGISAWIPKYIRLTHTLADLFNSGASLEKIEEYVLSSIKEDTCPKQ